MTEEFFKLLALCLITGAICIILKQKNSEYALFAAVAASLIVTINLVKVG